MACLETIFENQNDNLCFILFSLSISTPVLTSSKVNCYNVTGMLFTCVELFTLQTSSVDDSFD